MAHESYMFKHLLEHLVQNHNVPTKNHATKRDTVRSVTEEILKWTSCPFCFNDYIWESVFVEMMQYIKKGDRNLL